MPRNLRLLIALLATLPLVLILVFFGLIAGLSIIQQVLGSFIDLSQTSWTSFLNPSVLFGWRSPGGTGGILDALVGGPGAPGGSVNRYFIFMISGGVTFGAFLALGAIWKWTKERSR